MGDETSNDQGKEPQYHDELTKNKVYMSNEIETGTIFKVSEEKLFEYLRVLCTERVESQANHPLLDKQSITYKQYT